MNEAVLVILGVAVFTITVVGVLIYFYLLLEQLSEVADAASPAPVPVDARDTGTERS